MLEDLGNLGDFLGGVAVVVTLVYLALQIRQNTASIRSATAQAAAQSNAEILDLFARDPEVLRLYQAGLVDFDGLSPDDRARFSAVMGAMLARVEWMVDQARRGQLPPEAWEGGANRLRGVFAFPGTRAWWARGKHVFGPLLVEWVEEELLTERQGAPEP